LLGREAWGKIPQKCPSCGRKWWLVQTTKSRSVENALRDLQESIKALEVAQKNRNGYNEDKSEDYIGCDVSLGVRPL